jgi:hypothetical protein
VGERGVIALGIAEQFQRGDLDAVAGEDVARLVAAMDYLSAGLDKERVGMGDALGGARGAVAAV